MQLDVRDVEVGPGFEETAAFGDIRGHRAAPFAPVLRDAFDDPCDSAEGKPGEIGRIGREAENKIRMVLQVQSDAGQMVDG